MTNHQMQAPDGVLLVRKPKGWSSFDLVRKVKKMIHPRKLGHTGTLDPMATGLLPLVLGEATKLSRYLTDGKKRYLARVKLGIETDTLDAEGKEIARKPVHSFDSSSLKRLCEKYVGEIEQVPPMFSAIHHNGKRLYELARNGQQVERKSRTVTIHSVEFTKLGKDFFEMDVFCSAGTYIRTLASDMAKDLKTVGHLEALVRTEVGDWKIESALDITDLERKTVTENIIPLERALESFMHISVDESTSKRLCQGNRLCQQELESIGVSLSGEEQIAWFNCPSTSPIILSKLLPIGNKPAMEILRVLRPPK